MQAGLRSVGGPGLADPIGVLPPVVAIAADNKLGEGLGSAQVALCSPALLALSGRPARVVAMQGARVLLDTVIALGSDGTGCLRFELSLRRLRVGVVSLHALLEDDGVTSLVHSAQLLALPPDAAAEVAGLFETMTTEVARFFEAAGCFGACSASSAWLSGAFSQSLAAGTAARGAAVSAAPESMLPATDPAACYAYDHYFRPFLESWGVLTAQQQQQQQHPRKQQAAGQQQQQQQQPAETAATAGEGGGGSQAAPPASSELLNTYRRLLDYLLDHELFCCAVLLLNEQPELALQNMNLDVDRRDGGVLPELLVALARASGSTRTSSSGNSSGNSSSSSGSKVAALPQSSAAGGAGSDGDAANLLLRQLQERATAVAAQQAAHQTPSGHRPATEHQATSPARSPRLLSLWSEADVPPLAAVRQRELEAELELLDARFTGELTLTHVRGRGALAPRPQQPEQQPCGHAGKVVDWDDGEPASWAQCGPSAPLPPPPPRPQAPVAARRNDGSRGCGAAAAQAATTAPRAAACSGAALDGAVPSDPLALLRATVCGFPSASVEGFYAVFKSHYSNLMDTTALLYSFGTWLTCASRSAALPWELAVLLLYCLLYFFPYAVMLAARSKYLRHREAMLTVARCSSILLVGGVGALLPPLSLPAAWRHAVERTVTLHISHGVLLPACQQVRLQYTLAMAAAHWLGDGGLLLRSLPLADAALSSAAIQVTGLVITVVLDACSRHVFLTRYRGALAAELPGAACGGSPATGSAAISVKGGKGE